MLTKNGMCIKFNSTEISTTSRTTSGVKGINLNDGDEVITTLVVRYINDCISVFSTGGFTKRIAQKDLITQRRGGKGVICYKNNNDTIAGGALISDEDSVLIIGISKSICIPATDIPLLGRTATGNIAIKDRIQSVSKV
jgi:DNA gyrase subunit A